MSMIHAESVAAFAFRPSGRAIMRQINLWMPLCRQIVCAEDGVPVDVNPVDANSDHCCLLRERLLPVLATQSSALLLIGRPDELMCWQQKLQQISSAFLVLIDDESRQVSCLRTMDHPFACALPQSLASLLRTSAICDAVPEPIFIQKHADVRKTSVSMGA